MSLDPTPSQVLTHASHITVQRTPCDRYTEDYKKHPDDNTNDVETQKDFVNKIVYGIEGRNGDEKRSLKSVVQAWKDFRANFRLLQEPIPRKTTLSVISVRIPAPSPLSLPTLQIPASSAFLLPLLLIFRIEKADWATFHQRNSAEAAQPSPP